MSFVGPQKIFAHLDRLVGWSRGETPAPVTIEWDLSNRCVLGCQSCHFAHTHSRGPWAVKGRMLPMAYTETGDYANPNLVTKALGQVARAGVQGVVWTGGGEPTTHPEWLRIVSYAHSVGLQQGMYTLGGLFTPQSAAAAGKLLTWVVVSLDCVDASAYAREKGVPSDRFRAACDGIRWLVEAQSATVGVSFLLHAENWYQMPEMAALARSFGATYTTFRPTIVEGPASSLASSDRTWITEALPLLEAMAAEPDVECDPSRFAAYRDWTGRSYSVCHGIKLNTTITPDGRVWVCPQRRGMEGSQLGDLRTESFADIWSRHPAQWTDLAECRVMCRLHLVNEQLNAVYTPRAHEAFV